MERQKQRRKIKRKRKEKKEEKSADFDFTWKPGCVFRLEVLSVDDCDREAFLNAVAEGLSITVDAAKDLCRLFPDKKLGRFGFQRLRRTFKRFVINLHHEMSR